MKSPLRSIQNSEGERGGVAEDGAVKKKKKFNTVAMFFDEHADGSFWAVAATATAGESAGDYYIGTRTRPTWEKRPCSKCGVEIEVPPKEARALVCRPCWHDTVGGKYGS